MKRLKVSRGGLGRLSSPKTVAAKSSASTVSSPASSMRRALRPGWKAGWGRAGSRVVRRRREA